MHTIATETASENCPAMPLRQWYSAGSTACDLSRWRFKIPELEILSIQLTSVTRLNAAGHQWSGQKQMLPPKGEWDAYKLLLNGLARVS